MHTRGESSAVPTANAQRGDDRYHPVPPARPAGAAAAQGNVPIVNMDLAA